MTLPNLNWAGFIFTVHNGIGFLLLITNYSTFNNLKQHPYISSQFCRSELKSNLLQIKAYYKLKCQSGWVLICSLWGRNPLLSSFFVVVRIQFLVIIEMKSLLAGWPSPGSHSAPRGHPQSLIPGPLPFEASNRVSNPSHPFKLRLLLQPAGKKPSF